MVILKKGDLFESKADILAHGCNCRGAYSSGVAKTMATKYPKARYYYLEKYDCDGWDLGEVQYITVHGGTIIANCATQDDYTPRNVCHADYGAIRKCMEQVRDFAKANRYTVAMPKIGAGLAGGDWNKIKTILDDVFSDYDVTVYYLEN